jgi:tRNA pseudouridine38-40 synthase
MSEPLLPTRNIRLTLAYDGTHYCGWQVQPNGLSIQAVLERGIKKLTGSHSAVLSAGRTDSGVHAFGQVASFHTASLIPAQNFRSALQVHLPHDVVILDSREVPAAFHATFSAKRKRYRYVLYNNVVMLPFLRHYVHHVRKQLDLPAMQAAARHLIGKHDFRSFETDWPNKATSIRTVMSLTIRRSEMWSPWSPVTRHIADTSAGLPADSVPAEDERGGDFLLFDIQADGFLYNMVRSIVGTLLHVGAGRWKPDDVERILKAQRRSEAGNTAPACGLYLVQVDYE